VTAEIGGQASSIPPLQFQAGVLYKGMSEHKVTLRWERGGA